MLHSVFGEPAAALSRQDQSKKQKSTRSFTQEIHCPCSVSCPASSPFPSPSSFPPNLLLVGGQQHLCPLFMQLTRSVLPCRENARPESVFEKVKRKFVNCQIGCVVFSRLPHSPRTGVSRSARGTSHFPYAPENRTERTQRERERERQREREGGKTCVHC